MTLTRCCRTSPIAVARTADVCDVAELGGCRKRNRYACHRLHLAPGSGRTGGVHVLSLAAQEVEPLKSSVCALILNESPVAITVLGKGPKATGSETR